jgi:hypothetical protein
MDCRVKPSNNNTVDNSPNTGLTLLDADAISAPPGTASGLLAFALESEK